MLTVASPGGGCEMGGPLVGPGARGGGGGGDPTERLALRRPVNLPEKVGRGEPPPQEVSAKRVLGLGGLVTPTPGPRRDRWCSPLPSPPPPHNRASIREQTPASGTGRWSSSPRPRIPGGDPAPAPAPAGTVRPTRGRRGLRGPAPTRALCPQIRARAWSAAPARRAACRGAARAASARPTARGSRRACRSAARTAPPTATSASCAPRAAAATRTCASCTRAAAASRAPTSCARGRSRAWWTRPAAPTAWCVARRPVPRPPAPARSSAATTTSPTCPRATSARPPASWAAPSECATRAAVQAPLSRRMQRMQSRRRRRTSCEPVGPAWAWRSRPPRFIYCRSRV